MVTTDEHMRSGHLIKLQACNLHDHLVWKALSTVFTERAHCQLLTINRIGQDRSVAMSV